jgi:hypothetical protein
MLLTNNRSWERGMRKRTIKKDFKVGPVSVKFITMTLLALAALFYLAQSSQGSAQKYQVMQLSQTRLELESKTKDLEVEAARLKSLDEIKKSTQGSELVPMDGSSFFTTKKS